MSWVELDRQMREHRNKLTELLKIDSVKAECLATEIADEVRFLSRERKAEFRQATPIKLQDRLDELRAFQGFMDTTRALKLDQRPEISRAKVIVQNYICFVYLSESCFLFLRKNMPSGSVTKKCAKFLTDNPVRAFRNSVAHSNWTYADNFSGLEYWAHKGAALDEPLVKHMVSAEDLNFWQALCRCVAYAAFLNF